MLRLSNKTGLESPTADAAPSLAAVCSTAQALEIRQIASACTILIASALWCGALASMGLAIDGIPWYATLVAMSLVSVPYFTGAPRIGSEHLRSREPVRMVETWALTYLCAAIIFAVWPLLEKLSPTKPTPRVTQIVDIELTSDADFEDRNVPLPGTKEAPELHKRSMDKTNLQSTPSAQPHQAPSKPNRVQTEVVRQTKATAQANSSSATSKAEPESLSPEKSLLASMPSFDVMAPPTSTREKKRVADPNTPSAFMEEVSPPEMVEMMDNDGDKDSPHVFQSGGDSRNGKGSPNSLSAYLKELHRRIKSAWSPPRGQSRKAEILFRLNRNGRLAFLKLTKSSGDGETDAAALNAIREAASFESLPQDSKLPYLDVAYTFNYTADEIREINSGRTR